MNWSQIAGYVFVLGVSLGFLMLVDMGRMDYGPATQLMGVIMMTLAVWAGIEAWGNFLSGDTARGVVNGVATFCYFLTGYTLYRRGGPPRRKRRRVRNAIKRLTSGRLVPVHS